MHVRLLILSDLVYKGFNASQYDEYSSLMAPTTLPQYEGTDVRVSLERDSVVEGLEFNDSGCCLCMNSVIDQFRNAMFAGWGLNGFIILMCQTTSVCFAL